jgi:hypothetical protein
MKKYKEIEIKEIVTEYKTVTKKIKVNTWYYKLLLWLFGFEEERIKYIIDGARDCAWDKGFSNAQNKAHTWKEATMEKKLDELGYFVIPNFPMARQGKDLETIMPLNWSPEKSWDIIKKYN